MEFSIYGRFFFYESFKRNYSARKVKTFEVNDLQFRISFFQDFSHCLLAIHDIFPGSASKLLSGICQTALRQYSESFVPADVQLFGRNSSNDFFLPLPRLQL